MTFPETESFREVGLVKVGPVKVGVVQAVFDVIAFDADDTFWAHEVVARPDEEPKGYIELTYIGLLPALVQSHQFNSRSQRWEN
jgi:hypothetical protein